jgi:hypothetical protein
VASGAVAVWRERREAKDDADHRPDGRRARPAELGHAIRGERAELAAAIRAGGSERSRQVLGLFLVTAAYVAVDVSGRSPTDSDLRKITRAVAQHENSTPLTEVDVREYLSGAGLDFRPPAGALGDDTEAAVGPALITGGMLFIFRPRLGKWWDYLDQIERAYEAAETTDLSVLPALQVRARMLEEVESAGGEPG